MHRLFRLATLVALFQATLVVPASALPAQPPVQIDRCGTAQDQYLIPNLADGTTYDRDGLYQAPGTHDAGAGTVDITVYGYEVEKYTFTYTDVPCPSRATDVVGAVALGPCNPDDQRTLVTFPFTNVDDGTDYETRNVIASYTRQDLDFYVKVDVVADGQTAELGPRATSGFYKLSNGLLPGTYKISVAADGVALASRRVTVPNCGDEVAPEDEVANGLFPTGSVRQKSGTDRVKVTMNNNKPWRDTEFTLIVNRPGPGKSVKRIVVPGESTTHRSFRGPIGTVFVLKAPVPKTVKGFQRTVLTTLDRAETRAVKR